MNSPQLHDIEYVKHFDGGLLHGIAITEILTRIDRERCCEVQARLNDITPDNPGTDYTGNKFWVSCVRCRQNA